MPTRGGFNNRGRGFDDRGRGQRDEISQHQSHSSELRHVRSISEVLSSDQWLKGLEDNFNQANAELETKRKEKRIETKQLKELQASLERKKVDLERLPNKTIEKENILGTALSELKYIEDALKGISLNQTKKELGKQKDLINTSQAELENIKSDFNLAYNTDEKKKKKKQLSTNEITPEEKQLTDMKAALEREKKQLTSKEKALEQAEKELIDKEKALKKAKKELDDDKEKALKKAEERLTDKEEALKKAEKELADDKEQPTETTKQTDKQDVNDLKKEKRQQEKELSNINAKIILLQNSINEQEESLIKLQEGLDKLPSPEVLSNHDRRNLSLDVLQRSGIVDEKEMEHIIDCNKTYYQSDEEILDGFDVEDWNDEKSIKGIYGLCREDIHISRVKCDFFIQQADNLFKLTKHTSLLENQKIIKEVNILNGNFMNVIISKNGIESYKKYSQEYIDSIKLYQKSIMEGKMTPEVTQELCAFIENLKNTSRKEHLVRCEDECIQEYLYQRFKDKLPDFFNFEGVFLKEERESLNNTIEEYLTKIQVKADEIIRQKTDDISALQKQFGIYQEEKKKTSARVTIITDAIRGLGFEKDRKNKAVNKASKEYEQAKEERDMYEREKNRVEDEVNKLKQERIALEKKRDAYVIDVKNIRIEVRKAETNIEDYQRKLEDIKKTSAEIQRLETKINEDHRQQALLKNKHLAAQEKMRRIDQEVTNLRQRGSQLPGEIERLTKATERCSETLNEITKSVLALERQKEAARNELASARQTQQISDENNDRFGYMRGVTRAHYQSRTYRGWGRNNEG